MRTKKNPKMFSSEGKKVQRAHSPLSLCMEKTSFFSTGDNRKFRKCPGEVHRTTW